MTEALDKVLAAADLHDRTYKLARSWGATEELAEVFAASQKEKFKFDGVSLIWNANGKVASDSDDCRAHFTQGPLKSLFPTVTDAPDVPAELLASARAGNVTAKGKLYRIVNDQTKLDSLLADKSADDDTSKDASKNPWRAENFRTDKAAQARAASIIKSLGTRVAASMAKAAGKDISGAPLKAA